MLFHLPGRRGRGEPTQPNPSTQPWFRRLKPKLGTKAAVTAAAHKLARILWAMVKSRRPYNPQRLGNPELARARKDRYLRRQAAQLGFALIPVHGEVS